MKKIWVGITNTLSLLSLAWKRLLHNPGIILSTLAGTIAIVTLVVCVPVFSNAISSDVLRQQLTEKAQSMHRGLFSIHYYFSDFTDPSLLNITGFDTVTRYINQRFPALLGLPVKLNEAAVETAAYNMVRVTNRWAGNEEANPTLKFIMLEDLPQKAQIIEGKWPDPQAAKNGPIEAVVLQDMADGNVLSVGDRLKYGDVEIQISGVWVPQDANDLYWYSSPDVIYSDKLWVTRQTFTERVAKSFSQSFAYASWYILVDERNLRFAQASSYALGLIRLDGELKQLLPNSAIDYSPLDALQTFESRVNSLTTIYFAIGAPIFILALLFISLTGQVAVQQYEQEIVTMRGRGTNPAQVLLMNIAESLLLICLSLPFGIGAGLAAASLMGNTVSFLQFTSRPGLSLNLNNLSPAFLWGAAALILIARVLPVLEFSRVTIVKMKQKQARAGARPLWARFYLDFLLLIPGVYAYVTMSGWTKSAAFLAKLQDSTMQYRDSLLFIAPALFAIALCMIFLRVLPVFVRLLAVLAERFPQVWFYLSLQQIARAPQEHVSSLLLIMISLSISIYSASMAKTLDQWLYDSAYYQAGSSLALYEYAVEPAVSEMQPGMGSLPGGAAAASATDLGSNAYISVEDHLALPGVLAATRVGIYTGTISFGVGEQGCQIIGIDRLDFPGVAFFRPDFADDSLGALMNALAAEPYGVILPEEQAVKLGLHKGDQLILSTTVSDTSYKQNRVVVGTYKYFPTVYPGADPALVVNLDSIFEDPDSVTGYDIWMRLRPDVNLPQMQAQIRHMINGGRSGVKVMGDALTHIRKTQVEPERMGMFGILNVGFIATGLMPCIGFVLYSFASLRRRFIQLGILQALGLSVRQLIGYLLTEQFLLMGLAIGLGAWIGLITSNLYVPFLQVGSMPGKPIPPFLVLIGWTESAWLSLGFAIILILTMLGTIIYLARLKVFQAVKMGESL
jgi:putative ABC transport system permease protein